jgi:hypothetical protein
MVEKYKINKKKILIASAIGFLLWGITFALDNFLHVCDGGLC